MFRLVLRSLTSLCLLWASPDLWAQSEVGTATLNGAITDQTGAAVAGASVTATNQATGLVRSTQSNEVGLYSLLRLPVGTYVLNIEQQGFKTGRRTGLALTVGAIATINVSLEVGTTQESVTVNAEGGPVVETTRSQTSTVITEKAVRDLPINGRNFIDFTLLSPGVVRDPTRGGDLSFGGQRGTANSLLVDGSDANNQFFGQSAGRQGVRNPYSVSQDAVQEFQVNTSSYAAEIGRAGGGVVNVITKSGTNEFHGLGFWFFRDRNLNANNSVLKSLGRERPPYQYDQFGGNIGGPLVKDKLFFFFNYDGQRNASPIAVFPLAQAPAGDAAAQQAFASLQPYFVSYAQRLDNNVYLGKVDWNINERQTFSVRYNANRFTGRNFENGSAQRAPEATGDSLVITDSITANYTRVINPNVVWDSRLTWFRDDEPGFANATGPETTIRQNGQNVITFGRNNFSPRYTNLDRIQTIQNLSLVAGRHTMKFGADLNFERIDNFFPGLFSGQYIFNSLADYQANRPFQFTQGFAGEGTNGALTTPNVNEIAFYAQDQWRTSDKLTLNYGVRYDLFDYAQPLVQNPNPQLLAANLDTGRINKDTNNLAGRFGFAYRVTDTERMVVRGGAGMFYGRTPAILIGTAHSQNGVQVQTYTLSSNFPVFPNVLSAPPTVNRTPNLYVAASDYVQPLTYQFSLNVETQLGRDYAATVGYLGVRGTKLTRTRDINLLPSVPVQARLADGTPISYLRHPGRPNASFGRISLFDSGADSVYHGGFVQLTKRFSQNFQLQASYTFSKVIDTLPEGTSVVVGGGDDFKVAQDTLSPNLDRARGDMDVPHRFVLSSVWDLNYARSMGNAFARNLLGGWQLSTIVQAQSGRVFNERVSTDINNDGNFNTDRSPYVGRNTLRGPAFGALDLRLSRDIALWPERVTLRIIGEAFNLTNRTNISGINQIRYNVNTATQIFTPNPLFRANTAAADPRIVQVAAKIIF